MPRKGQKLTEAQKQKKRDMWAAMTPEARVARTAAARNLSPEDEKLRREKLSQATTRINQSGTRKTRKIIFTADMIADLSLMGDQDFSKKWQIDRGVVIRRRKELGIKSFNNKHGTVEHRIENGVELKLCQHCREWKPVNEFRKKKSRIDGLDGWCRSCSNIIGRKHYVMGAGATKAKMWRQTPTGKLSLRTTWRKQSAIKKNAYVQWSPADEQKIFDIFKGLCAYCDIPITLLTCEFDHFIPMAKGGLTEPANMVPCCSPCNRGPNGKFDQEPEIFLRNNQTKYAQIYKILRGLKT